MKTRSKLTVFGTTFLLTAIIVAQSAQAFTMTVDEYTATLIRGSGRWISGTVVNPTTGMTEWLYYYPLQYENGYAGSDGQWYYVMTFGDVEQLDYIDPYGNQSYWGTSGNNWDPYLSTGVATPGGGGGGGSVGGGASTGGHSSSGGILGIPFPGF